MTVIFHDKNFKPVMSWPASGYVTRDFSLDVGAVEFDEHSVMKALYDSGWRGINVEPDLVFYSQLQGRAEACTGMAEAQVADILNSKAWQLTASLQWAIRQFRILQKKLGKAQ